MRIRRAPTDEAVVEMEPMAVLCEQHVLGMEWELDVAVAVVVVVVVVVVASCAEGAQCIHQRVWSDHRVFSVSRPERAVHQRTYAAEQNDARAQKPTVRCLFRTELYSSITLGTSSQSAPAGLARHLAAVYLLEMSVSASPFQISLVN